MEEKCASIRGIYRDTLKDKNTNITFDSGWRSNLIVHSCRTLLAAFMKNDNPRGIQYLKVGKGDPAWDTEQGPPKPNENDTALLDPDPFVIPIDKLEITYLDDNDQETPGPTNRLRISTTLEIDQPPPVPPLFSYPMREFGLFGEYTDPDGNTHEYMIDYIRHPVIHKDASTTLGRVVKLYF